MKFVRESADKICEPGIYFGANVCAHGSKPIAQFDDKDSHSFGLDLAVGHMKVSSPGKTHVSMDKEYERSLGYDEDNDNIYEGRLWKDKKIISFWDYPPPEDFEKVIKSIESELYDKEKIDLDIWNDPDWKVEVIISPEDGEPIWNTKFSSITPMEYHTKLIPVKNYGGSLNPERTEHEKSPLIKKKSSVPYGFGSKHPKSEDLNKWRMAKPFESFVPASLDESMEFERGKDPKKSLDLGLKGYMCSGCGEPTTENGENLPYDSELFKKTVELFKHSPNKIESSYCADCYYNDLASEEEQKQARFEENLRWWEENEL
jgi:hypothetical protein